MKMSERVHEIFQAAHRNLKCNTAYPVFKEGFRKYESDIDVMAGVSDLSYYIHIPFCRHLCKFCEYTRFQAGNRKQEDRYLELLEAQIRAFVATHPVSRVYGLDIGGGTPSALDDGNFELVMEYADPIARRVYREEAKQLELKTALRSALQRLVRRKFG